MVFFFCVSRWCNRARINYAVVVFPDRHLELTKRGSESITSEVWPIQFSQSISGSFSDNFNFSMKKASRAYNFCFISKRHVVFKWQSVGQIKTRLKAPKYKKDWIKFIFWLIKCLKFLPSRFTVLVTHSITCIILPLSNIIIYFKISYPWKQTTE